MVTPQDHSKADAVHQTKLFCHATITTVEAAPEAGAVLDGDTDLLCRFFTRGAASGTTETTRVLATPTGAGDVEQLVSEVLQEGARLWSDFEFSTPPDFVRIYPLDESIPRQSRPTHELVIEYPHGTAASRSSRA